VAKDSSNGKKVDNIDTPMDTSKISYPNDDDNEIAKIIRIIKLKNQLETFKNSRTIYLPADDIAVLKNMPIFPKVLSGKKMEISKYNSDNFTDNKHKNQYKKHLQNFLDTRNYDHLIEALKTYFGAIVYRYEDYRDQRSELINKLIIPDYFIVWEAINALSTYANLFTSETAKKILDQIFPILNLRQKLYGIYISKDKIVHIEGHHRGEDTYRLFYLYPNYFLKQLQQIKFAFSKTKSRKTGRTLKQKKEDSINAFRLLGNVIKPNEVDKFNFNDTSVYNYQFKYFSIAHSYICERERCSKGLSNNKLEELYRKAKAGKTITQELGISEQQMNTFILSYLPNLK